MPSPSSSASSQPQPPSPLAINSNGNGSENAKRFDSHAIRSTLCCILAERAAHLTQHAKVTVPESHAQLAYHNIVPVANECLARLLLPPRPLPFPMSPIEIDHLLFPSGLTMRLRDQVIVNVDQLTKVVETALELRAFEQSLPRPQSAAAATVAGSGSSSGTPGAVASRSGTVGRRALPPVPPPPTYAATVRQAPGQFPGVGGGPNIGRRSASLFGLDSITAPNNASPPPQTPPRASHTSLHYHPHPSSPLSPHAATPSSAAPPPRDASPSLRSLAPTGSPVVSLAPYRPSTPLTARSTSPPVFQSPPPSASSPLRSQSPLPGGVSTQSPMRPSSAMRMATAAPAVHPPATVIDAHSHSVLLPLLHTSNPLVPPSPSAPPPATVTGTSVPLASTRIARSQPLADSDDTLSGDQPADLATPLPNRSSLSALAKPSPVSSGPTSPQRWAIPARANGRGERAPALATLLLVTLPIAVLALCIVLDGGLMPVSTNPWLGPAPGVLVRWGARAVPCMRASLPPVPADALEATCGPLRGAPGHWWRWISAGFVPRGVIQVALTSVMVARFGGAVEKGFGPGRVLGVFMVGNVGGLVASALAAPGALETGANSGAFALLAAALVDHLAHWSVLDSPLLDTCKWTLGTLALLALGWLLPFVDNTLHVVGWLLGVFTALALRPRVQLVVAAPRLVSTALPSPASKPVAHTRTHSLASTSAAVLVTIPAMALLKPWQRALVRSVDVMVRLVALGVVVASMYIGLALFYDFGGIRAVLTNTGRVGVGGAIECGVCRYLNWATWPA